ncbi:MAG: alpha-galactosidase [Sphingomonadaceae bacterium]|nr:alpha-galactosidase [Sphingomonadaceae bacterium]
MAGAIDYVRLDGEAVSLVFALTASAHVDLVYCGARLGEGEDLAALHASGRFGRHESQPDAPPVAGILPEAKAGYAGHGAIELRRGGRRVATDFRPVKCATAARRIDFTFEDDREGLRVEAVWAIGQGDVIRARMRLHNRGKNAVSVERLASLALPIPRRFSSSTQFAGRWAGEMREYVRAIAPHGVSHRSRGGKPGFDDANWLLLHDAVDGAVIGAHLAWSGDHETLVDRDADGRAVLLMGAGFDAGEIVLAPGESCESAEAVFALALDRSALGRAFHANLRADVLPDRSDWGPRKVHLNSWEALGFDIDETRLLALADGAADLGVERFVLDDGWFGGRRDERSSLGDWTVSADVLPNGLEPLIDHIENLGMDFGLWVEPEMVSPESDLYRAHPDWCLHEPGRERLTQRRQLVLDLSQAAVTDFLFDRLDALLGAHRIAYLKWDHNRDLFPAANPDGPVGHAQTTALYALIDRLRAAHPQIEIESCASGGGRIDYAMLSRCHRVWTSDNNDAIERLRINRGWAQFLPLEVIGSHVGPSPNPVTGRRLGMDFRAKATLFGHMGVEADPATMSDSERDILRAHVTLYKQWRDVLHDGCLFRLDHPDEGISGLLAEQSGRGLALVAQTRFAADFYAAPVHLVGLDADAAYRVTLPEPWPGKAARYLADPDGWRDGHVLSGRALMERGLALPLTHPESAWLIALERIAR